MIKFYLTTLCLFFISISWAQNDCCIAQALQDGSTVTVASSAGNGTPEDLSACSCLATDEHDSHWFAFECVTAGTFEMMITPAALSADFDFAVYANVCPCDAGVVVAACDYTGPISPPGPFVPTGISSTPMATFGVPGTTEFRPTINLTAGTVYYIIADNITTNGAGFDIEFGGTAVMGPPPAPPGGATPEPINGEITACPGSIIDYEVPILTGFDNYTWEITPATAAISGNGDNNISVAYGFPGVFELCVTAQAGCVESEETCLTINVTPIPQGFDVDGICINGSYTAPTGQVFTSPGSYPLNYTSYQGCDSTILLTLTPLPISTHVIVEEICDGDCYTINGETFCASGTYEQYFTNYLGCDSTLFLTLVAIPSNAVIIPDPPQMIDCNNSSIVLDGSLSVVGSNPTYTWTDGSGMIVGNDAAIDVTIGGTYTLSVTGQTGSGNTCTDEEIVFVVEDSTQPDASAFGGTIDCINNSVFLSGISGTPGANYSWSGPNFFFSTDPNPQATEVGTYTLTVTAPNGCTNEATAEVTGDTTPPDVSAMGTTIDCANPDGFLTGSSITANVTYSWSGPNSFSSQDPNPLVNEAGTYTLIVTAGNGCTAEATAEVTGDLMEPDISATGSTLDCTAPTTTIFGNSITPGVTYSWTGPNSFISNDQNPIVTTAGFYTLVVTGPNGCNASLNVEVMGDMNLPDISASGGTVDCINTTLSLSGNSNTPGVTYSWTGPNSFVSNLQNPSATDPGTYVLTVLAPNGCASIANAEVLDDSDLPDISASGGTIDCNNLTISINGNSTTANVTYSWVGPNSFTSGDQNPDVTVPGSYTLTVAAPNGCSIDETIEVMDDTMAPDIATSGGTIDCNNAMIALSGNSNTVGVTYAWTGPNTFTSSEPSPTINEVGTYTLIITAPNGCTATETAEVLDDTTDPDISADGGTIDCLMPDISLSGNSTTVGVTYAWTGPNTFSSSMQNPMVNVDGTYTLTVTGTNGCTSTQDAIVISDMDAPDIEAAGDTITCVDTSVPIFGNSNTNGVSYAWTGPGSFTSTMATPTVNMAGDYTLTVTAPNGCTSDETIAVIQDADIPDISVAGDILNCTNQSINLSGNSTVLDVTYAWTGPVGFMANEPNPAITVPGDYTLVVTAPNGCTANDMLLIDQDIEAPDVFADGGFITCTDASIALDGQSLTVGVTYSWEGPGGFNSTLQNPDVSEAGAYTLTVTALNGCTESATATVLLDGDLPDISVDGGTLDCNILNLQLSGNSNTADVVYSWEGPNSFTSDVPNPDVNVPGSYTLTVTAPNACSSSATALVIEDIVTPDIETNGGTITCNDLMISLSANSMTSNVAYAWTGPNTFSSDEQNPLVGDAGTYTLLLTAPNGCTSTEDAMVDEDLAEPDVSAAGGTVDCNNPMIALSGNSNTTDATLAWTGPNSFVSDEQNPMVSMSGDYILTVTGTNGCTAEQTAIVIEDLVEPDAEANGGVLDCNNPMISISANSSTANVNYSWTGPNSFTSDEQNPMVTMSGAYTLTVTAMNGCTTSLPAIVDEDVATPDISSSGGTITCLETSIGLTGNSITPGALYSWTGPNTFSSDEQNPTVNISGDYILTITAPNGCVATETAQVLQDTDEPDATADGGTLDCNDMSLPLAGNSSTPGVSYSWTGPNTFSSDEQNPVITASGDYVLTVTAPNGCTISVTANVLEDVDAPMISADGGILNCTVTELNLTSSSNPSNVTYAWTGPNSFSSDQQNPLISEAGNYTLVVTSANGCTSTIDAMVDADIAEPDASANGGLITCMDPTISIAGNSTTPGITYSWTGPGSFTSSEQNPMVDEAGIYILTVTAPNGCTSQVTADVDLDADVPEAEAEGGTITCLETSVSLTGNSNQANVTYSWTGPNAFTSDEQNPLVFQPGTYTLTVTAPNDCTSSASTEVLESLDLPYVEIVAEQPGMLNCAIDSLRLDGSASDFGPEYSRTWWTADGFFLSGGLTFMPYVGAAGTYNLTITNELNGCSSTATIEIDQNESVPSGGDIQIIDPSCFGESDGSIFVDDVQGGTPPYLFSINGGALSSDPLFTALAPGNYDLVIEDALGCTWETALVLLEPQDLEVSLTAVNLPDLSIKLGEKITLIAQVNIPPSSIVSVVWLPLGTAPIDCTDCLEVETQPVFSTTYEVIVTDINGCVETAEVSIFVDTTRPVFVPNAFSPNNDGINDLLYIQTGQSVASIKSFLVFNRWGETVYQFYNFAPNDPALGWDGMFRGKKLNAEVFTWFAQIEFVDGQIEVFKGDVMLVK